MKTIILISIVVFFASHFAQASDAWDTCSSSDGLIQIEHGSLVLREDSAHQPYVLGKLVKQIPIKTRKETCQLINSGRTVISLEEQVSFEVYEIKENQSTFKIDFLCSRGGSGIPANDECNETTAKMVEKYLVK